MKNRLRTGGLQRERRAGNGPSLEFLADVAPDREERAAQGRGGPQQAWRSSAVAW